MYLLFFILYNSSEQLAILSRLFSTVYPFSHPTHVIPTTLCDYVETVRQI